MRKLCISILASTAIAASAQTQINPATQIKWPNITGAGTPTSLSIACSSTNYGQPYTDTTNSNQYVCMVSGWVQVNGGSDMVYPGAGIPNSTGTAWGTSYGVSGTGSVALTNSPTFVTPALGTPASVNLANATGYPQATTSAFGIVKPDGSSITISGGVISAVSGGSGTVTTTGSPASGNLTKFSGATSITNGNLSGDATTSGTLALTLATVNSGPGSCGDATHVCQVTTNGKGLTTAQTAVAITATGNTTSTSLTTNTLPKANGANSIINSSVSDNGTTVSTTDQIVSYGSLTGTCYTANSLNICITSAPYYASGSGATTTVTASSGATSLTVGSCTTGQFDSGSAGIGYGHQGLSIVGAGAGGVYYIGTVSSCSGTTMVVTPALSTSVSGATVRHDETAAILAAFTALNSTGGIIWFPDGHYYANGPLLDTGGANAVLPVPALPNYEAPYPFIEMRGFETPSFDQLSAAQIENTAQTSGCLLGGYDASTGGGYPPFTNTSLILEDLQFFTPAATNMSGVCGSHIMAVQTNHVLVRPPFTSPLVAPSGTTSIGLGMPQTLSNVRNSINDTTVAGYNQNVIAAEHTAINTLYSAFGANCLTFDVGSNATAPGTYYGNGTSVDYVWNFNCTRGVSAGSNATTFNIEHLDSELNGTDIYDPSNLLHGTINAYNPYSANALTINGATNLTVFNLYTNQYASQVNFGNSTMQQKALAAQNNSNQGVLPTASFMDNTTPTGSASAAPLGMTAPNLPTGFGVHWIMGHDGAASYNAERDSFVYYGGSGSTSNYWWKGMHTPSSTPPVGLCGNGLGQIGVGFGELTGCGTTQALTVAGNAAVSGTVAAATAITAPSITLNGGTPLTGQSSAQSQIVTCPTGGTTTQYCGADGAWHAAGGGSGTVTSIATTGPITGGTITTTGTIACPTCGVTGSPLSQFAATTSAQLAGVLSDETGTGSAVFGTSPTLVTPALGTPSALVLTNATSLPAAQVSSGALVNGMTATTQTTGDNTTKLATDAFVIANAGAVTSVSNSDGTLTISPTMGAVVASIALGHANTWTGVQTFYNGWSAYSGSGSGNILGISSGGIAATLPSTAVFSVASTVAATSGANANSAQETLVGNSWNGSSSIADTWTTQDILGTGSNPTSTLTISHSGSSGASTVAANNFSTTASGQGFLGEGGSSTCTAASTSGCTVYLSATTTSGKASLDSTTQGNALGELALSQILPNVVTDSGTSPAINLASGATHTITLSGNTTATVSNLVVGARLTLQVCQPASGGPYTFAASTLHGLLTIGITASDCSQQEFISVNGTTMVALSTGVINVAP